MKVFSKTKQNKNTGGKAKCRQGREYESLPYQNHLRALLLTGSVTEVHKHPRALSVADFWKISTRTTFEVS